MKGTPPNTGKMKLSAYAGGDSEVAKESRAGNDGFKRGGKAKKNVGNVSGLMSSANAGRKPRKAGGGVFSSAAGPGIPRKSSAPY